MLRVPAHGENALAVGNGRGGRKGAFFGHPDGQVGLKVSPASSATKLNPMGSTFTGIHLTRRKVFVVAAELAPGDSGRALVDAVGMVVGVAFAIAPTSRAPLTPCRALSYALCWPVPVRRPTTRARASESFLFECQGVHRREADDQRSTAASSRMEFRLRTTRQPVVEYGARGLRPNELVEYVDGPILD